MTEATINQASESTKGQPMSQKQTYIKVTYQGGDWCICDPKDLADMTVGAEGYKTEEVQMTKAEFEAMPEFQG